MIRGVCNENLFDGSCSKSSCDGLHLNGPVQITDGHFHHRLLSSNWYDRLSMIKNVDSFVGINNNHQAVHWDDPLPSIPDRFSSKVKKKNCFSQ